MRKSTYYIGYRGLNHQDTLPLFFFRKLLFCLKKNSLHVHLNTKCLCLSFRKSNLGRVHLLEDKHIRGCGIYRACSSCCNNKAQNLLLKLSQYFLLIHQLFRLFSDSSTKQVLLASWQCTDIYCSLHATSASNQVCLL